VSFKVRRRSAATSTHVTALGLVIAVVATPIVCAAQGFPGSQRGRVEQTLAFTDIAVTYGRPVARGRVLFGDSGLVRWRNIWNPGADSATRVSFSQDVLVEGRQVAAGEYSVWLIPQSSGQWTFILNRAAHVFHQPYPGDTSSVLRLEIPPERGAHMETLAFYFPVVLRDEAVMRFHWGEMVLPVRIKAPYRPR
jgi:hypothetical protein